MRLEDIAKLTIDEVNAQLQGTSSAVAKNGFIVEEASDNDEFEESNELRREFDFNQEPRQTMQTQFKAQTIAQKEAAKKNAMEIKEMLASRVASIDTSEPLRSRPQPKPQLQPQAQTRPQAQKNLGSSEMLYLQGLKERIGVLFEGLNSADSSNSEFRMDMTIKFLEFMLASIDNRLSNLSK